MTLTVVEAYKGIKEYFSQPGAELAITGGSPACRYRTEDGRKCAIGCLIPDEKYRPTFDNGNFDNMQVLQEVWPELSVSGEVANFLFHAQELHDNAANVDEFISDLDHFYTYGNEP